MGRRNHVVISVLCVVVTGSVGWSRRRNNWRVNGRYNMAWRMKNEENLQRWRSDDQAKKNAKLTTGERLTKR